MDKGLCPYCKTRPRVKKTCRSLECMHQNDIENQKRWREKYGHLYRPTGRHALTKV